MHLGGSQVFDTCSFLCQRAQQWRGFFFSLFGLEELASASALGLSFGEVGMGRVDLADQCVEDILDVQLHLGRALNENAAPL